MGRNGLIISIWFQISIMDMEWASDFLHDYKTGSTQILLNQCGNLELGETQSNKNFSNHSSVFYEGPPNLLVIDTLIQYLDSILNRPAGKDYENVSLSPEWVFFF